MLSRPSHTAYRRARTRYQRGGVLAYATESCFGLGCHPASARGLRRVVRLKGRAQSKGMIVVGADWAQLAPYIAPLSPDQLARLATYWPGAVTLLLPASRRVLPMLRGKHRTLAVRLTAHPATVALCRALGGALVSTSANHAGQRPHKTASACRRAFGHPALTLSGQVGSRKKPSTIVDFDSGRVLR